MKKASNYIVWGLLLATFHITLGNVQILPSFIGWALVVIGVGLIRKEYAELTLKKASMLCKLLVLLTVVGLFVPNMNFSITWSHFIAIIASSIELMIFYQFFQGITVILLNSGKIQLARDNEKILQHYLIFQLIGIIAMGIGSINFNETLDGILVIYLIVLRIYITYQVKKIGKYLG